MNIFTNPNEHRLRAGWRLGAQFFLMFLIGFILIWLVSLFYPLTGNVIPTTCIAIGAVTSMWAAARGLDFRSWRDYGLFFNAKNFRELLVGFGLAGGVIAIVFAVEYAAGWVTITGYGWDQTNNAPYLLSFATYFLWMVVVSFYEELVFRGYQIVNLSEGLNFPEWSRQQAVWGAVGISSLVFGLMHALNPNAGWISTLNIAAAGVMLALPFIITGRLSVSIGLHMGWNIFQGGVFGFPVSGVDGRASLLQINQQGPGLITGGIFGPEAGLIGLAAMILITGTLLVYFKKPVSVHGRLGIYNPPIPRERL